MAIFKAYDIRGIVPDELDCEAGLSNRPCGGAFHRRALRSRSGAMRGRIPPSSQRPSSTAFATRASMSSTSASWRRRCSISASKRYRRRGCDGHGLAQSRPLQRLQDLPRARDPRRRGERAEARSKRSARHARRRRRPQRADRIRSARRPRQATPRHVLALGVAPPDSSRSRSIAATAWRAWASRPCSRSFRSRWCKLYFEPDGSFPNHEADPLKRENLEDLVGGGAREAARISASRSTATAIAPCSSTAPASPSPPTWRRR